MCNKVILIGAFLEIIELCEENNIQIRGIVDNNKVGEYYSYKIIGTDKNIESWLDTDTEAELVISPDLPQIRKKLAMIYKESGFNFATIKSCKARISRSSIIRKGVVIQAGVNISSEVVVGEFVKINNHANIMHNVEIGKFTTVAPNAVLLGHVKTGEACYIGANATVLPHVTICDNVTIGAGAVVTKSIKTPFAIYAGVPARYLNKRS